MSDKEARASYRLTIIPESPLLLGNQSSVGNFHQTEDFIPGSALYGAVGGDLLSQCTQPDYLEDHESCPDKEQCPFWRIFGQGQPMFGNAYPGGLGPVWPFPATARTCKQFPGYQESKQNQNGHGVTDCLFTDFAYDLISDPHFPYRRQLQPELGAAWSQYQMLHEDICLHKKGDGAPCKALLIPATGYYAWRKGLHSPGVFSTGRATKVAINRARSVAEDELLFTQESIEPTGGMAFYAQVAATANVANLLEQTLEGKVAFLGRGRSRGLGEVTLHTSRRLDYPPLADRLARFQKAIRKALTPYQANDSRIRPELPGHLFSLTLRAPAILEDQQRPLQAPLPDWLGLPNGTLFLRAWARAGHVGGWDSAARAPRRTRLAVNAGSVYLYFAPEQISVTKLLAALEKLENTGIGQERERGYGEVTVCAAFHYGGK